MGGRPAHKDSQGQALLEMAILAPLLFLILLGALDLGRVFYYHIAMTNAAREAARYGSNHPTETTVIQARAQTEAAPISIPASRVTVSLPNGSAPGQPIQVTVTYPFRAITPLISRIWGGGDLLIRSDATMVIQ